MQSMVKYGGWVVALACIVAVAGLEIRAGRLQEAIDQSNARLVERDKQVAALTSLHQEVEQKLAKLKDREDVSTKTAEANGGLDTPVAPPSAEPSDSGKRPDPKVEAASPSDADKGTQQRVVEAQMGILTDMEYGKLFAELNLPEDLKAVVRDKLVKANMEIQSMTASMLTAGDKPAKEYARQKSEIERRLRDDLGQSLSGAQLAEFDAFQPEKNRNQYETLLDGQLAMLAPDLSMENRATAKLVFAEELVIALDEFENTDAMFTLTNFNNAQMTALQQGLDRMAPTLDEAQYRHLEGFVGKVADAFAAMSGNAGKR